MYSTTNQKCNFFITSTILSWIEGPLAANLVQINGEKTLGKGNIWISFLIRKETDDNDEVSVKLADNSITWNGSSAGVEVGYFGRKDINGNRQWSLKYYTILSANQNQFRYHYAYKDLGPITIGKTDFVVLNLNFMGTNPTGTPPSFKPLNLTVQLNPEASTLGKSQGPNGVERVFAISRQFRNVVFYGGNSKGKGSMDEFRLGSSYAAVTPTVANNRIDIRYAANYYPFGAPMPGRSFSAGLAYRYGFNGQERETELSNAHTSAEFWMYDGRIGRRWNVDPIVKVWESSYASFVNNPVKFNDPDGLDVFLNGKDAKKAARNLNKSSSLKIKINKKTGQLSAKGDAKTDYDKKLNEAINSTKVRVNLTTTRENTIITNDGKSGDLIEGAFGGNSSSFDNSIKNIDPDSDSPHNIIPGTKVTAEQFVNLNHAKIEQDFGGNSVGQIVGHEINEAYIAADETPNSSSSNNSSYLNAHHKAINIDKNWNNSINFEFNQAEKTYYVTKPIILLNNYQMILKTKLYTK